MALLSTTTQSGRFVYRSFRFQLVRDDLEHTSMSAHLRVRFSKWVLSEFPGDGERVQHTLCLFERDQG